MANEIFIEYGKNPVELFRHWFGDAKKSEPSDANAAALATADRDGVPSVRIVLVKEMEEEGFVFYTNFESRKGANLQINPLAELNFHWKSLKKQVRISGPVEKASEPAADAYYASRPRDSQIGAWASAQSRPLAHYEDLEKRFVEIEKKFPNRIPRPPHWGGFRIKPDRMEFWIAHPYRLHKRFVYIRKSEKDWGAEWLFP